MSEDYGTVNLGRGQTAREFETLRQRYLDHRDSLSKLAAEAPSDQLAGRYRQLIRDIEAAIRTLEELAGREGAPGDGDVPSGGGSLLPATGPYDLPGASAGFPGAGGEASDRKRSLLILATGIVGLLLLGLLVWRFTRGGDEPAPRVVEETAATAPPATVVPESEPEVREAVPAGAQAALSVTPASHDFGTIKKGSRAVRQFRVENRNDQPAKIRVKRSACRCLWFDNVSTVPPNDSVILVITLDGAKAKAGRLNEVVEITSEGGEAARISLAALIQQ